MHLNSISNVKLHCCLAILILFILVFLSLPLLLIYLANYRYEEIQEQMSRIIQSNGLAKLHSAQQDAQMKNNSSSDEAQNSNYQTQTLDCTQFAIQANLSLVSEKLQCPEGSFPCTSCPKICIVQGRICNGIPDCPDKSDESSCHDSNGALVTMYGKISLQRQNAIRLANKNQTKSTSTNAGSIVLPNSCTADDIWNQNCKCNLSETEVIICEYSKLKSVPNLLLDSVHKVFLNNNEISNIDDVKWPKSLTALILENNLITHIGRSAFQKTPHLIRLCLTHNQISYIDIDSFNNAPNLTSLLIDSNKLTTFDPQMLKNTRIRHLNLVNNMIELPDHIRFGENFPHLEDIALDRNRITIIRKHFFSNMTNLAWLSLTFNQISAIEDGAFDLSLKLDELNLSSNKIKFINRLTFAKNLRLTRLYLGANPLQALPVDVFKEVPRLKSLNLTHVEFDYINRGTFSFLQLDFIYFSKFRYCYYATHVRNCRPHTDGLSTAKELLAFPILKFAVWIVAFVCIIGNVFVFIWRSVSPHEDRTLSLIVRNLSIADLMMGIYLATIGWHDWSYQQDFGLYAIQWMSSWTCTGIGFLAIFSSELSVFILTIITIERYRSITSISRFEEAAQKQRARVYVALAWLFSFLIAFYPIVEWVLLNSDFYATNGLCLPLHIDQPFTRGWQYSAFVYLGINFSAVITIMALYLHMYTMIIDGRQVARPALLKAEKREDVILAIRFFFIVVTDCLCWIPIVVIKIMALSKVDISSSIYGWLVVFIIPINSALNPIVYTLAAPTSLRDAVFRLFERICYKVELPTTGSSNYSSLSSSNASANLDPNQANVKRLRVRGSNSTTCDNYDASSATNSKGSVESALIHHDLRTTSTCSSVANTILLQTAQTKAATSNTTSNLNTDGDKYKRVSIAVEDKVKYCYNHVSGGNFTTTKDDEHNAVHSENIPKKPYDYISTYENNTLKHKIINTDQIVTDPRVGLNNELEQTEFACNPLESCTNLSGLSKSFMNTHLSSSNVCDEQLDVEIISNNFNSDGREYKGEKLKKSSKDINHKIAIGEKRRDLVRTCYVLTKGVKSNNSSISMSELSNSES